MALVDASSDSAQPRPARRTAPRRHWAYHVASAVASLKLTVFLFAIAIFIILAGTLAQADKSLWQVIDQYFRTFVAWIDLKSFAIFLPPEARWLLPDLRFPFPGGWLIGLALGLNLLAAHGVRFKVQAAGMQLAVGLGVMALGGLTTAAVIYSGNDTTIEGEMTQRFQTWLWIGFVSALGALCLALLRVLLSNRPWQQPRKFPVAAWWTFFAIDVVSVVAVLWLAFDPALRLDGPGMRILWQLLKASIAGAILLTGSVMVFKRRGAIVALHLGVGLMMFGELWAGLMARENQMPIFAGFPVDYVENIQVPELAIVDHSDPERPREYLVSETMLRDFADRPGDAIPIGELPLEIRVEDYFANADLPILGHRDIDPESRGFARIYGATKKPVVAGAAASSEADIPTARVEVRDRRDDRLLGKFLVSVGFTFSPLEDRQYIELDGKHYEIALRFRRQYKPYSMTYLDFNYDKYIGTQTAKNYSARLQLVDESSGMDRQVLIWMNNPLRYSGETFYQSGVRPDKRDTVENGTVLQVVANTGWMIPYTSCGIVGVGMFYHFILTLVRFLGRTGRSLPLERKESWWAFAIPAAIVVLAAASLGQRARPAEVSGTQFDVLGFGDIPVAHQGRVKPLETVARSSMMYLSGRDYFKRPAERPGDRDVKVPAIQWLLDVAAESDTALEHSVFHITDRRVLGLFDITARKDARYSIEELIGRDAKDPQAGQERYMKFVRLVQETQRKEPEQRDPYERQVMELAGRIKHYEDLAKAFRIPPIRLDREHFAEDLRIVRADMADLGQKGAHVVPPQQFDQPWRLLPDVEIDPTAVDYRDRAVQIRKLLLSYADGEVEEFNKLLGNYLDSVDELASQHGLQREREASTQNQPGGVAHSETLDAGRLAFEVSYNRFAPFTASRHLYLLAFVLSVLGWLGFSHVFQRCAWWLLLLTFVVHMLAIAGRVYISGRPPITNLYSTAIYIGCAGVLFGMVFERIFHFGIGNLVASLLGFASLTVAHYLGLDGDTIVVLQAVLDTNFWLATHVTIIVSGYTAMFVAGLFGALYVLLGVLTPALDEDRKKALARMNYGTMCFAIFFSFVGTVLGGLWADDSWGRFWGWDPKENGALMIVIWSALALHARWGGIVRDRGFALLALGGSIITAWSYFGTNALGIGLHSYGFQSGTWTALRWFWSGHLALIALGLVPLRFWVSNWEPSRPSQPDAAS